MKKLLNKIKPFWDKVTDFYKKISDIATPTAVLTIICIVVTLALSSANALTHKKIENLSIENQNKAMSKLMDGDYIKTTKTINNEEITYHVVEKDGKTIGYIFITSAKGYGDTIQVMTAINLDASVAAVEILDASGETPGLGQNITKESFYSQYTGHSHDITVVKGGSADKAKNEINAVTGATISSKAVTNAVNQAIDYTIKIIESNDETSTVTEELLTEGDELK